MKLKNITITLFCSLLLTACQNQNKINFPTGTCSVQEDKCDKKTNSIVGTYEATLPCADCSGKKTTITLNSDNTYTYKAIYEDRLPIDIDTQSGTYEIKDNIVTTQNLYKEIELYKFNGKNLIMLGNDGKEPKGALAKFYIFKKIK